MEEKNCETKSPPKLLTGQKCATALGNDALLVEHEQMSRTGSMFISNPLSINRRQKSFALSGVLGNGELGERWGWG